MEHTGWFVHGNEPKKGSDRGKAGIAAAGAVATTGFDMGEEVTHQGGIQILDVQLSRRPANLFACEVQQQAESITIARNCVRARLHLVAQSVREELLDEGRQSCSRHGRTS